MPIVDHTGIGFVQYDPPQKDPEPVEGSIWGAAFSLENDVGAMLDFASRPSYQPELGFNLGKKIKELDRWDDREHFLGSVSTQELDSRIARLDKERHDRQVLESAGWAGVGAAVVAGVLSPTMLIPLTAGGRGLVAVGRAAFLGLAAGAAQELPLQFNQYERTLGETTLALGASTILSGLLGSAAVYLTHSELDRVAREMDAGMAATPNVPYIPGSVGAASAKSAEAGKLTSGVGINQLAKLFPTSRVLNSESPNSRWTMAQLSDGGLGLEGNARGLPTTLGGTAENRIKTWYSSYWKTATKIDELYQQVQLGEGAPSLTRNMQANVRGFTSQMNKMQFRQEIARAMFNGDAHDMQEVADAAKFIRKELWDPLYKEAVDVGIFNGGETALGDPSHMLRMFNTRMIEARQGEFINILSSNYEKKLQDEFTSSRENFLSSEQKFEEYLTDIKRPKKEVETLRTQFQKQLETIDASREKTQVGDVSLAELEDQIAEHRAMARLARQVGDNIGRKNALEAARNLEQRAGEPLAALKQTRANVRRRLKNLTRAEVMLEERHAKKLEKLEALEESNIKTFRRAIHKAEQFKRRMSKWTDEKLDTELVKLKDEFARLATHYDKIETRIARLAKDETPEMAKLLESDGKAKELVVKLNQVSETLDTAEQLPREAIREVIDGALDSALSGYARIVGKRARREDKLIAQAEKLTPQALQEHIIRRKGKIDERARTLNESFRARGADAIDIRQGLADFSRYAKETAEETARKITGTYLRLPTVDILQQERGSEIARVLDISSNDIWDFLEQDVEKLMRAHLRTMAPDVEIMRKFRGTGSENFDWRNIVRPIVEERDLKKEAVANAVDKKGNPRSAAWKQKEQLRITDEYAGHLRDIEATISRLRHTWGIPQDPNSIATRLGRTMMNLNVLRLMGTVTITSIPDVARPVMKYGLMRTMQDGFIPLITNFKQFKLSAREVKLAGSALDFILSTRAAALFDILDDVGRQSKLERGIEYAAHHQGVVGLFDYWTSGMKQFAGVVANAEMMDSLRLVVEGGSAKDVKEATTYLARLGMDGDLASTIWKEIQAVGGGDKVNGVWWPNTEAWKNPKAVRAYRAALVREVDNAIVTPGVERPLWTNSTMLGRTLSQFQSFAYSSTSKVIMAGLQEKEAKVFIGMAFSLALGALSYYIWAATVGGDAWTEANKFDPAKYADEAISRSGLLGIGDIGQRIRERIPATSNIANFSGQRSTKRGGEGLIGALAGPSFDMIEKASSVIMGIDDPTQSTANAARHLLPWQNVFYLRQLFDKVISGLDLPESRQ